jgi:hypothetical protein
MNPNMTGLNQTGFGASSPLGCSARTGFEELVRAMREILVDPARALGNRTSAGE